MVGRTLNGLLVAILRYPAVIALCIASGIVGLASLGCQPTSEQPPTTETKAPRPAVSSIPLRVWIVAPVAEAELLQRQWLAKSEQPLELRSLTVAELLDEPNCQCDVLLYPASLIGELVQRGWIVKQPSSSPQTDEVETSEQEDFNVPATWLAQATYAGETMGLSLGCALPVFVASPGLAVEDSSLTWDDVLSRLQVAANDSPSFSFDDVDLKADIDAEAVVDRFLTIVASLSDRDPGYGMLFDLQSMQARLTDPEYIRAAGILAGLGAQPDGLTAILGSHSTAWKWAATRQAPALAIAAPILLDQQAAAIDGGQILSLQASPASRATEAASAAVKAVSSSPLADRPQVAWWSASGGLVASMSSRCRQSHQAQVCLHWMQSPPTRTVMSTLIPGIEAATPTYGNETLSWQAQRQLTQGVKVAELSLEPRLPLANQYRRALSDELQQFLSGKKNSVTAMKDAAHRWNETTRQAGATQRRNYEQSLNL